MQNLPISAVVIDHTPERKRLLKEAVQSILHNSYLPSEILIILDMDSDIFVQYKQQLKKDGVFQHSFIQIVQNRYSRGPAGARNFSLNIAKYDWIAFLDSDDLWHSRKLSEQWKFLQKRPHVKACHTKELWIKNHVVIPTPKRLEPGTGKFLIEAFRRCLVSMSSVLIQKQVIWEVGSFDERLKAAEDYDFWLRYLIHYPIAMIPDIDYQHPPTVKRSGFWKQTSQTKNIDVYRLYALMKIYEKYWDHLSSLEKKYLIEEIQNRFLIVRKQKEKYIFTPEINTIFEEIYPECKQLIKQRNQSFPI